MEEKTVTIRVSEKLRNKLMRIKYDLGLSDLEEVIAKILVISTKVEPKLK